MKVQVKHGYKDGIKLYTGLYKERGYIRIDDAESGGKVLFDGIPYKVNRKSITYKPVTDEQAALLIEWQARYYERLYIVAAVLGIA